MAMSPAPVKASKPVDPPWEDEPIEPAGGELGEATPPGADDAEPPAIAPGVAAPGSAVTGPEV